MVRILVECPALIATVRVGVLEALKPFEEEGLAEVRFQETMQIKANDLAWCDVLISVRGCDLLTLQLVQQAQRKGRFIVYYLDDDLLNLPESSASAPYYNDEIVRSSMKEILALSDVLWCVNPNIANKYSQYGSMRVVLTDIPCFSPSLEKPLPSKQTVNVLYAGSTDHEEIIQTYLTPVVKQLAKEYAENVRFIFVGADPHIFGLPNVHHHKFFSDYDAYRKFVVSNNIDIGIALVAETEFYACKYYNKFVEYTALGAVGVYSNLAPYTFVVQDRKNGFLFENSTESLYEKLSFAISHPEERSRCIAAAVRQIAEDFSYATIAASLRTHIPEFISYQAPAIAVGDIHLYNRFLLVFQTKSLYYYRKYGFLSIPIVLYKCIKSGIFILLRGIKRLVKGIF